MDSGFSGLHTVDMIEVSEQQIIDQLVERLATVYAGVEPARVTRVVREEYARFDGRPIRDFVPLLVERSSPTWFRSSDDRVAL